MSKRRLVAYSQRLGAITDYERRIEQEPGASLRIVELWSAEQIWRNAADANILMVGAVEPLDDRVLRRLPRCQLIVRRGAGHDNIDLGTATSLGIPVAVVPDASVDEVSEHALALLLAMERKLFVLNAAVRDGSWSRDPNLIAEKRKGIRRLSSLTLGIVGLGRIGRAMANRCRTLFAELLGYDPNVSGAAAREVGVSLVTFEELLRRADLVTIHAALTPGDLHLFDRGALAYMKSSAYLVNTARGQLVDEEALVEALKQGRLAGAALDVTEEEPLSSDSALLAFENVLITAHSAAHSDTATAELRRRSVEATILALQGKRPPALANPQVVEQSNCRITFQD